MDAKEEASVSGALAVVLQMSRVVGIAPLRFAKQSGGGWSISLSTGWHVYGCVVATFMNIVTSIAMMQDFMLDKCKSIRMQTDMRRVVWILDASVMMTLVFHGVFAAPRHLQTVIHSLNQLQKINRKLSVPQTKRKEIILSVIMVLWIVAVIIMTLFDNSMQLSIVQAEKCFEILYIQYLCYYFCYWLMQLQIFQFVLIVLHIRQSFIAVNKKLEEIVQGMSDLKKALSIFPETAFVVNKKHKITANIVKNVKTVDQFSEQVHEAVRRLSLIYLSICDVTRETDIRYGSILMLLLGSFLLHMTITPYYLINNFFHNSSDKTSLYYCNLILQCVWCVFHCGCLLMVIEPCHLTLQELMVTRVHLSQLMRHASSPSDPLAVELELFSRQLVLNQVSYSPLQITTLSRSLVASVLGTIITYLVVIVQL